MRGQGAPTANSHEFRRSHTNLHNPHFIKKQRNHWWIVKGQGAPKTKSHVFTQPHCIDHLGNHWWSVKGQGARQTNSHEFKRIYADSNESNQTYTTLFHWKLRKALMNHDGAGGGENELTWIHRHPFDLKLSKSSIGQGAPKRIHTNSHGLTRITTTPFHWKTRKSLINHERPGGTQNEFTQIPAYSRGFRRIHTILSIKSLINYDGSGAPNMSSHKFTRIHTNLHGFTTPLVDNHENHR